MDRVFSLAYHTAKVTASATLKSVVLVTRDTPKWSTRLSVINVPKILIRTTLSQYIPGTYFLDLNWKKSATINRLPIIKVVLFKPRFSCALRKSAAVSPTVVHRILMIQK